MNVLAETHPPFTSAEFYRMAARGAFGDMRVELRRGMILKMSPQHLPHGLIQTSLLFALQKAIDAAGLPWKAVVETTISYGCGFEPMPDITVVDVGLISGQSGPIPSAAVKLVVEVADSSLADDMGEKREDYAAGGLAEYWVADVAAKRVIRHARPEGGRFAVEADPLPLTGPLAMLTQPDVILRP